MYQVHKKDGDSADIVLKTLPNGVPRVIARGGHDPRYVSSGHIVFVREGSLFAVPFNLGSLRERGSLTHILDGIASRIDIAHYDISDDGTLVYVPGKEEPVYEASTHFEWIDRDGNRERVPLSAGKYRAGQLSPNGNRLAYILNDDKGEHDIWVHEFGGAAPIRVTFDSVNEWSPTWSPSGKSLVLAASETEEGGGHLFWLTPDRGGVPQPLWEEMKVHSVNWSPVGEYLVFSRPVGVRGYQLMALPVQGNDQNGWLKTSSRFSEKRRLLIRCWNLANGGTSLCSLKGMIETRSIRHAST